VPQRHDITGLVLAGGRGARFGGRDKGLIEHAGVPLALHALRTLAPQVGALLVSANRNAATYAQWAAVVADDEPHHLHGPIAGMLAALAVIDTPWLAVVPCDLPGLPADAVARLAHAVGTARCAHAAAEGRHALACLLHRDTRPLLAAQLARGERRIGALYAALGSTAVPFAATELVNLNAPADLAAHATPDA
jgi:molybdopterin-guanine dinucleotide biosynthesis protein A